MDKCPLCGHVLAESEQVLPTQLKTIIVIGVDGSRTELNLQDGTTILLGSHTLLCLPPGGFLEVT